jgi:hypothetical protein
MTQHPIKGPDRLTTFGELFEALDERVEAHGCGPELRHVRAICDENKLDADLIVPLLEQHGGHCDCEVLENAERRIDADKRLPLLA